MHRNTFVLASAVACALLGSASRAENLLEVYQDAVKNDPLIREAEARREAALEVKPQARGLLLPQVNINGQWAQSDSDSNATFTQAVDEDNDPKTPPVIAIVNNQQATDQDFWNYQAEATQTLFRWDQWQQLKRADAQVAAGRGQLPRRAAGPAAARIAGLFRRAGGRGHAVGGRGDAAGVHPPARAGREALRGRADRDHRRAGVPRRARQRHGRASSPPSARCASTHEVLRELTGEAYQTLTKPAEEMPLDQPQPADEESWVAQALEQNLNVIAARLGVDVAKRNVKIAQAGHMPTVDLFANRTEFDANSTQINNGLEGPADSDQTDDTYGVRVNIPIFAGGATQSRVREQVHLHRAERERLEGAIRRAERDTRDAYLGVLAEKARVTALNQSVKSNQTALEATEAGFEVGTRTTVDVLDARRRLFEAQRDYARSRYDYLINFVRLKSAAGVLAPADLQSINGFLTTPTTVPVVRPKT